jgi:small-conductance mechanosensitive channel
VTHPRHAINRERHLVREVWALLVEANTFHPKAFFTGILLAALALVVRAVMFLDQIGRPNWAILVGLVGVLGIALVVALKAVGRK